MADDKRFLNKLNALIKKKFASEIELISLKAEYTDVVYPSFSSSSPKTDDSYIERFTAMVIEESTDFQFDVFVKNRKNTKIIAETLGVDPTTIRRKRKNSSFSLEERRIISGLIGKITIESRKS